MGAVTTRSIILQVLYNLLRDIASVLRYVECLAYWHTALTRRDLGVTGLERHASLCSGQPFFWHSREQYSILSVQALHSISLRPHSAWVQWHVLHRNSLLSTVESARARRREKSSLSDVQATFRALQSWIAVHGAWSPHGEQIQYGMQYGRWAAGHVIRGPNATPHPKRQFNYQHTKSRKRHLTNARTHSQLTPAQRQPKFSSTHTHPARDKTRTLIPHLESRPPYFTRNDFSVTVCKNATRNPLPYPCRQPTRKHPSGPR